MIEIISRNGYSSSPLITHGSAVDTAQSSVDVGGPHLWGAMINLEKLLEPDSPEVPACRCGEDMVLSQIVPTKTIDTEIKIFRCDHCKYELRLMVWCEPPNGPSPNP